MSADVSGAPCLYILSAHEVVGSRCRRASLKKSPLALALAFVWPLSCSLSTKKWSVPHKARGLYARRRAWPTHHKFWRCCGAAAALIGAIASKNLSNKRARVSGEKILF